MAEHPRYVDAAAVHAALPYPTLIEALRDGFRGAVEAPPRHHHTIPRSGQDAATFLLMPAWRRDDVTGIKLVHVAAGNENMGLPSVQGLYVLFDGPTGTPRLVLDGASLTLRRTAAASALAADYLARRDTSRMVVVGSGALAPHLVRAHASVRPIAQVTVWSRTADHAAALADALASEGFAAEATADLEEAVRAADLVSCATMSRAALVRDSWVRPGTHIDLVGAYSPDMRESEGSLFGRAEVFVDTREGAMREAGDILLAIDEGHFGEGRIRGDLGGLCRGERVGRTSDEAVTVFKSVGTALEDLVAAKLVADTPETSP